MTISFLATRLMAIETTGGHGAYFWQRPEDASPVNMSSAAAREMDEIRASWTATKRLFSWEELNGERLVKIADSPSLSTSGEHQPRADRGPGLRGRRVSSGWQQPAKSLLLARAVIEQEWHLAENATRRRYRRENGADRLCASGRSSG